MLVNCNDIVFDQEQSDIPFMDSPASKNQFMPEALRHPSELGELEAGTNKHFYSNGAFNLIQLVLFLLDKTGPANLFLCTYSISTDSINTIVRHRQRGDILSVGFLIDNRVRTISPKPFDYLITSFPESYRCCALHARLR